MVSPFENPFPTRGRGPWTPWGAGGSRWFLRMPSTGRDAPTASCSVLPFCWHRVAFWGQGRVLATKVAGAGLGSVYTKESLSFGKQPSPFKGRNQSWFHPLRTPSRPGAAAPGPQGGQRAVVGFSACHRPAAMHRPPAARFYHPIVFVLFFENKEKFCLRWWLGFRVGDPSNRLQSSSVGMTVIWNRRDSSVAAAAGLCLVCHPERACEPRDLHAGIAAALVERALPCSQKAIR